MGPGRRVRSEATWAAARDAYLAGAAAGEVCERYGLGLTALRDRAKREGWRRRDRPDPEPAPEDDPDDLDLDGLDSGAPAVEAMIERAWRYAARALGRGRLYEARGWTRLVRELDAADTARRNAAIHAAEGGPDGPAPLDAAPATAGDAERASVTVVEPDAADSVDSPDSSHSADSPGSVDSAHRVAASPAPDGRDLARRPEHAGAPADDLEGIPKPESADSTHASHRAHRGEARTIDARPLTRTQRRSRRRRRARLATLARDGP